MDQTLPTTYDDLAKKYLALHADHANMLSRVEQLEELLRLLQRSRFGASSESLLHPGMRSLFQEDPKSKPEEPAPNKTIEVPAHKREVSPRKPLPDHLPREDVHVEASAEDQVCPCCSSQMEKIHEKVSEKLHVQPARHTVKRYLCPVFRCKACEEIKQTKMPPHPIPKCSVTSESIAHVIVSKVLDGLPLHRQEKILARSGIEIGRDQMARWLINVGEQLVPLKDMLHKDLIEGDRIAMDETSLQVLKENGRRPDQKSHMIVQVREGPPGRNITLFHYERSRSAAVLGSYLEGFEGSLLTDGLASYQSFTGSVGAAISHGGCWSHSRRKFTDAVKGKKRGTDLAKAIVELMQKLFKIEKDIQGQSPEKILAVRADQSKPVIEAIEQLWRGKIDAIPAKSLTGKGLHYLKNQWEHLTRFLVDPNLQIHNNYCERQIRPFAVARKAWLFHDTPAGANATAVFYSLLNTAKENGLNPYEYMCHVLRELPKCQDLTRLLPFAQPR